MTPTTETRAAIVRAYKEPFQVETVAIEAPRADEVLVRMVSSGICHTDMVFRDGDGFAVPVPCVLGHEGAGVVDAIGASVTSVVPGDHVILTVLSCGHCSSCFRDLPTYCLNTGALNYSGGRMADGTSPLSQNGDRINAAFFSQSSFATFAIANERNTLKVGKDLPLDVLGPLSCGFQTGVGAVINGIGLKPGETMAVFGGGAVGLSAMLAAIAVGGGEIIVVEPVESRRELALALGAAHVVDPGATKDVAARVIELSGGGVNHAVDATGIPAVVETASNVLLPTGILVTAGVPPVDASLPVNMLGLLSRGIAVKGISVGGADPRTVIIQMIEMYRAGKFPFDRLISKYPFEEINAAFDAAHRGDAIKAVLTY